MNQRLPIRRLWSGSADVFRRAVQLQLHPLLKVPAAVGARRVHPHVVVQVKFVAEALPAHLAGERADTEVRPLVALHVPDIVVRLLADVALEALPPLRDVHPHVLLQVVLVQADLLADVADELARLHGILDRDADEEGLLGTAVGGEESELVETDVGFERLVIRKGLVAVLAAQPELLLWQK